MKLGDNSQDITNYRAVSAQNSPVPSILFFHPKGSLLDNYQIFFQFIKSLPQLSAGVRRELYTLFIRNVIDIAVLIEQR